MLTYVTQSDVKGWIPTAMVNYVTSTAAPELMKKLVEAAKKYPDWIKETEREEACDKLSEENEDKIGDEIIHYGPESRY